MIHKAILLAVDSIGRSLMGVGILCFVLGYLLRAWISDAERTFTESIKNERIRKSS